MKNNIKKYSNLALFLVILIASFMPAQATINALQYSQPNYASYASGTTNIQDIWPDLGDEERCNAEGQDFFVTVVPTSCTPAVVRSDLLQDQNVPVFCKMNAIRINPLVDLAEIKSVTFSGSYPKEVAGISYHPSQSLLKTYNPSAGSGIFNDLGYVVILLKRQESEKTMPNSVHFNLSANMKYDLRSLKNLGNSMFLLPVMSDTDFQSVKNQYSFWQGRGYLRADDVTDNEARITIYSGDDSKVSSFSIKKGETTNVIYMPGFYCKGGLRVRLNDITAPKASALIQIDDQSTWVTEGAKFLDNKCYVKKIDSTGVGMGTVIVSCAGKSYELNLQQIEGKTLSDGIYTSDSTTQGKINEYFAKSMETAQDISNYYSAEKDNINIFGAFSLLTAADTAINIKKEATAKELLDEVIRKYPDTNYAIDAKAKLNALVKYDSTKSSKSIVVGKDTHNLFLRDIKPVSTKEASALFDIAGKPLTMIPGQLEKKDDEQWSLYLKNIVDIDTVAVEYTYRDQSGTKTESKELDINKIINVGGRIFTLKDVNYTQVAFVDILSELPDETTKINVSVNIGIEKSGIPLSPEKTKNKIKNLNESIKKYQDIVDKLSNWTDVQSKACFVTASVLFIKNFIQGAGGKGMARSQAMQSWNAYCAQHKAEYDGSIEKCISANSKDIEKSVDAMGQRINNVNKYMDEAKTKAGKTGNYEDPFMHTFAKFVDDNPNLKVTIDGKEKTLEDLFPGQTPDQIFDVVNSTYSNSGMTIRQMQDIMIYALPDGDLGSNKDLRDDKLEGLFSDISKNRETLALQSKEKQDQLKRIDGTGAEISPPPAGAVYEAKIYEVAGQKVATVPINDVGLVRIPVNQYTNYYLPDYSKAKLVNSDSINPMDLTEDQKQKVENAFKGVASFSSASQTGCTNKYLNPEVRLYDNPNEAALKGKAELVPVDLAKGWYVATKPAISGIGKPYSEAGQVLSMYLVNVGPNGMEEWGKASSDDKPEIRINFNTGQPIDKVPCTKTEAEARTLVNKAREALEKASSKYGTKAMDIDGTSVAIKAATAATAARCTDFMSDADCKLMFNLCDPVVCPASRCNLGGSFPVANVIQSGIIGSLLLCLPNVKQGIIIPVCLTGINEGFKAYVSLLKSHRDCLQESLTTGKRVGICDEMYSLYMCEFLWRQMKPLLDAGIPRLISAMLGQKSGGGEYMTVNLAWQNMQSSVSYIQGTYTNSFSKIFSARSTEQLGTEICQGFVSANYPVLGDLADSLLKPESPVQFSAWFDEIPFSEATVPPTSQYKVYYHIYAGTDAGSQYSVYLKDSSQTSAYVATQGTKIVDSGFVGVGQSIDQTKDFTAPAGYKQLCVRINQKEECGFKRVSSNFALDYLNDKYIQSQTTDKVESESECISGTPSLYSLAQPGFQAGLEELAQPGIYQRGIIRICSTSNPGENSEPGRWSNVGYCDKQKGVYCWLDSKSVTSAIEGKGVEDQTIQDINKISRELEVDARLIMDDNETGSKIEALTTAQGAVLKEINKATIASDIIKLTSDFTKVEASADELALKGFSNQQRANAMYLKFAMHKAIIDKLVDLSTPKATGTVDRATGTPSVPTIPLAGSIDGQEIYAISLSTTYTSGSTEVISVYSEDTESGIFLAPPMIRAKTSATESTIVGAIQNNIAKIAPDVNERDKENYNERKKVYDLLDNQDLTKLSVYTPVQKADEFAEIGETLMYGEGVREGIEDFLITACLMMDEEEFGFDTGGRVAAAYAVGEGASIAAEIAKGTTAMIKEGEFVYQAGTAVQLGEVVHIGGINFVKSRGGSIIGRVNSGGSITKVTERAASSLATQAAQKGLTFADDAIAKGGGVVIKNLHLDDAAKVIDKSTEKVLGTVADGIVANKGSIKYASKASSKLASVLKKISPYLSAYATICTTFEISYGISEIATETAEAQAAIYQAEAKYGDLVLSASSKLKNVRNKVLIVLDNYDDLKDAYPGFDYLENDIKNINTTSQRVEDEFRFLAKMQSSYFNNDVKKIEGTIFKTETKFTDKELTDIIAQNGKFRRELDILNGQLQNLTDKIVKLTEGQSVEIAKLEPSVEYKSSNEIKLVFYKETPFLTKIKWDFEQNKVRIDLLDSNNNVMKSDLSVTDSEYQSLPSKDKTVLRVLLTESESPEYLAQNILIALRSERASVTNVPEEYPLTITEIKDMLFKDTFNSNICGNRIAEYDQNEVCDSMDIGLPQGYYLLLKDDEFLLYTPSTPRDIVHDRLSATDLCSQLAGYDCNDAVEWREAESECRKECKQYWIKLICKDTDYLGNSGQGEYLVNILDITTSYDQKTIRFKRTLEKEYIKGSGTNQCKPSS